MSDVNFNSTTTPPTTWGWGASYEWALIRAASWNMPTQSAWTTCNLDTEVYDTWSFLTLSSDQFTLLEWEYIIKWICRGWDDWNHSWYIYNVSDSTTDIVGTFAFSDSTDAAVTISHIDWYLDVPSGWKTFEMRYGQNTNSRTLSGTGDFIQFMKIS